MNMKQTWSKQQLQYTCTCCCTYATGVESCFFFYYSRPNHRNLYFLIVPQNSLWRKQSINIIIRLNHSPAYKAISINVHDIMRLLLWCAYHVSRTLISSMYWCTYHILAEHGFNMYKSLFSSKIAPLFCKKEKAEICNNSRKRMKPQDLCCGRWGNKNPTHRHTHTHSLKEWSNAVYIQWCYVILKKCSKKCVLMSNMHAYM